ncbi:hypothetical protein GGR34_002691 [Microvirga flocculans]|uniref:Phosphoribosylamine--glycine ligase n=1 Tax=Microvirga flocculans TaxID=217168 RepID=A0A7W6N926_9HYPH|nr:hypothetical protein [Microvirga flocculans]MBB4041028.1 hypothetical protein [Microvirga flocculans]
MRALPLAACIFVTMSSLGLRAQEQSFPATERGVQKAACEEEARRIYRTSSRGVGMAPDVRERMIAARRAHVRECLVRAGPAPG